MSQPITILTSVLLASFFLHSGYCAQHGGNFGFGVELILAKLEAMEARIIQLEQMMNKSLLQKSSCPPQQEIVAPTPVVVPKPTMSPNPSDTFRLNFLPYHSGASSATQMTGSRTSFAFGSSNQDHAQDESVEVNLCDSCTDDEEHEDDLGDNHYWQRTQFMRHFSFGNGAYKR